MGAPRHPPSPPPTVEAGKKSAGADDVKQRANFLLNKLSDRDTEAIAAAELSSMAVHLPSHSLPSFISSITDTRPSDKPALRRHSLNLVSLLSRTHPPSSLSPYLPRLVAAVLRRLRDRDSAVRAACVAAVRALSAASFSRFLLKPLSDTLLLDQDRNAQIGSALCLIAAVQAEKNDNYLLGLVPKLVRLARSEGCKAKPAVLSLLGEMVGLEGGEGCLGLVVPCLAEGLGSEEWAARKAAAEALTAVAGGGEDRRVMLEGFKESYFGLFLERKFDRVKVVREAVSAMLEEWKEVPGSVKEDEERRNESRLSVGRCSPCVGRKQISPAPGSKRISSLSFCRSPVSASSEKEGGHEEDEDRSTDGECERTKILSEDNSEGGCRNAVRRGEETFKRGESAGEVREGDLCALRKQLLQIESQQMNLLDLLQRFIGNSQNGIRSLETRVQGLEMALEVISQDLVASDGRSSHCCKIPMPHLLSSRFWRRTESKYSQILGPSKPVSGQLGSKDDCS